MPITMLPTLKEMILQKELGIISREPSDVKNDSLNNLVIHEQQTQR